MKITFQGSDNTFSVLPIDHLGVCKIETKVLILAIPPTFKSLLSLQYGLDISNFNLYCSKITSLIHSLLPRFPIGSVLYLVCPNAYNRDNSVGRSIDKNYLTDYPLPVEAKFKDGVESNNLLVTGITKDEGYKAISYPVAFKKYLDNYHNRKSNLVRTWDYIESFYINTDNYTTNCLDYSITKVIPVLAYQSTRLAKHLSYSSLPTDNLSTLVECVSRTDRDTLIVDLFTRDTQIFEICKFLGYSYLGFTHTNEDLVLNLALRTQGIISG